jgi:hypothetical protein
MKIRLQAPGSRLPAASRLVVFTPAGAGTSPGAWRLEHGADNPVLS